MVRDVAETPAVHHPHTRPHLVHQAHLAPLLPRHQAAAVVDKAVVVEELHAADVRNINFHKFF